MATPYEFVARALRTHLPAARLAPAPTGRLAGHPDQVAQLYHGPAEEAADFSRLTLAYPNGYPTYYPAHLTLPGRPPLTLRIAAGTDALLTFTRPDTELRQRLAHYGYWRIEEPVRPADTDYWLLLLPVAGQPPHCLVLPAARLRALLTRAHNPEKFSLLLARAGFSFAGQPLTAANRLAVLQNPALLATPEYAALDMQPYLDNWQQFAAT